LEPSCSGRCNLNSIENFVRIRFCHFLVFGAFTDRYIDLYWSVGVPCNGFWSGVRSFQFFYCGWFLVPDFFCLNDHRRWHPYLIHSWWWRLDRRWWRWGLLIDWGRLREDYFRLYKSFYLISSCIFFEILDDNRSA